MKDTSQVTSLTVQSDPKNLLLSNCSIKLLVISTQFRKVCCLVILLSKEIITCNLGVCSLPNTSLSEMLLLHSDRYRCHEQETVASLQGQTPQTAPKERARAPVTNANAVRGTGNSASPYVQRSLFSVAP